MKYQIIQEKILVYKKNNSNKVYKVFLIRATDSLYQVDVHYGKRGNKLKEITKTPEPISFDEAETIFYDLVNSKLKKGYREAAGSYPKHKTLEQRQAIIDKLRQEATDNFYKRIITAGLNPLGDLAGTNLSNLDFNIENLYKEEPDLSNANLANTNLSGSNFSRINLSQANLKNANISYANLSILSEADLTNANLSYAYLDDAFLDKANCIDADFTEAIIGAECANFEDSNFERAKFIKYIFASENSIDGCNFSYGDFSHAQDIQNLFGICEIKKGVNFSYANFSYTYFRDFNFSRLKLNLRGARFYKTDLRKANLANLDLSHTNFTEANLAEANLENCNLQGANLNLANLKGANFKGVNWQNIGACDNIKIDLKTQIDEQWRELVNQKAFIPNLDYIVEKLETLQNKPTWQLVYAHDAKGLEFPINRHYQNKDNLIEKINNGHSLKVLIKFIGENKKLSLSPPIVWLEEVPKPNPSYPNDSIVLAQYQGILAQDLLPQELQPSSNNYYQSLIVVNTKGECNITYSALNNPEVKETRNMLVAIHWFVDV